MTFDLSTKSYEPLGVGSFLLENWGLQFVHRKVTRVRKKWSINEDGDYISLLAETVGTPTVI